MNKLRDILKRIKDAGHFYILLVPERSSPVSSSRRLSPIQLIILILLYTAAVGFFSFMVLRVSPVDTIMFEDAGLSGNDKMMVTELDQKLKVLSEELQSLRNYNIKLRAAIRLADSTLFDSTGFTAKKVKNKLNAGGNIFAVFRNLFSGIITEDKNTVFFTRPVNGFISRDFYPERGHTGLDFVVKTGTPIYAAANGYILFADYTEKDGYQVIISHPENYITIYKHCSYIIKKQKDNIVQGELIALSGNTGDISTGPHLHFEIWMDGKPLDPKKLLIDY